MTINFGAGLHAAQGHAVDSAAYDLYIGRWSRLFVPTVLAAAGITPGSRVLDVCTGTGEASLMTLPAIGAEGVVIGADISPAMLEAARARLRDPSFCPVAADGQQLPFADASFDAVICQLGLQFFPDPARGLAEFRRVLRSDGRVALCVVGTADQAPMWGHLADAVSRFFPELRNLFYLAFSLADPQRLERLLAPSGFRDIRIERQRREDTVESIDDYWQPIEAGTGSIPQAYRTLSDADRRSVRDAVDAQLSRFKSNGKLTLGIEMLIAQGRA